MKEKSPRYAVIYARVSSVKQLTEGSGLSSQRVRCEQYAEHKGLEVIQVFHDEGISGSLVERPAMQAMLEFLKQQSEVTAVLIDDISRLARGMKAHLELRTTIEAAGGKLLSPSIEFGSSPDEILVENLMASVSQHFRDKNREQSINRTHAQLIQGYSVASIPAVGYKYKNMQGHGKLLVRNEPAATIVQHALESFACGRFETQSEVRNFLNAQACFPKGKNGDVTFERVRRMLENVLYAGYIHFPARGINMVPAKHEPLISYEMYLAIQNRLNGQAKAPTRKDLNLDFPLRGFITCSGCGETLTSAKSKGRSQYYDYYLCYRKGCSQYGKSAKAEKVESEFNDMLIKLKPSSDLFELAKKNFSIHWGKRRNNHQSNHASNVETLKGIESKIEKLVARVIDTESPTLISTYEKSIQELERKKAEVDEKIKNCGRPLPDFETTFRTAMNFLENPHKLWLSDDIKHKRTVLKLVFTDKLEYDLKLGFRTAKPLPIAQPFWLTEQLSGGYCDLVPGAGLEPARSYLRGILNPY
ncbi:recombinase family protein [Alteromonas sp. a30]|uniref:recombinase family protein n=1 Tax=Alteromonas sp. a30 TaxID=2730917 RepID=UPI00228119EF|nr:recombinase family protein [Alteromonas sp. a30]MCY7297395.1 recombinase family protein [Alteromonas sp. a30]